jgi:hypothetical protein
MKDKRYTIQREFIGQPTAVYVVRFCDKFVGWRSTRKEGVRLARLHKRVRAAQATVAILGPMFGGVG